MPLPQGGEALQGAIDRAKQAGKYVETEWLKWEDQETKFVRFLTDISMLYVLNLHDWYPGADGKRKTFVCRKVVGESCDICERDADAKPRELGFGVAVVREPVRDDSGKIVDFKDKTKEVDGKVRPIVGIVRQAPTNFWIYVQNTENRRGSIRGYDLEIQRQGDDTKTLYMVYDADVKLEIPSMDERYAKYTPDVGKMLEYWASREYYDVFLHGKEKAKRDDSDSDRDRPRDNAVTRTEEPVREEAGPETEFDRLRRERQRLQEEHASGGGGTTESAPAAPAQESVSAYD